MMSGKSIVIISFCLFLLAGCTSFQNPYNIKEFNGGTEILSYLPRPCNYSAFPPERMYGGWDVKDIKYTTIKLDEQKKINFAFKKYVDFYMPDYRPHRLDDPPDNNLYPFNRELAYIELEQRNFSCEDGEFITYWKIGENGKDSIAVGIGNLYSEYFGAHGSPDYFKFLPNSFMMRWDGTKWGEKEKIPDPWGGSAGDLAVERWGQQDCKNNSLLKENIGAYFGIETEKMLSNATAVCIKFVDGKTRTGFSWGNPNNFSTYNPLVFIDHCLWYEWDYNGTVSSNGISFNDKKSHDFQVYGDIKKIEMNMTYNQSSMNLNLDDLDIVVYDAAGKKVAESRKGPGEAEEIMITNFSGFTFGNWRVEIESKNTIFEVKYNGMIRADY